MGTPLVMPLTTYTFKPTGGASSPNSTTISTMMPNQMATDSLGIPKSKPITIGKKIGMVSKIMDSSSITAPKTT